MAGLGCQLGRLGHLGQGFLLEDCYEGAGWVPRFVVRRAGIGQAGRTCL